MVLSLVLDHPKLVSSVYPTGFYPQLRWPLPSIDVHFKGILHVENKL